MKSFLFLFIACTFFLYGYSQKPGTLDSSFGKNGVQQSNFSFYNFGALTLNNRQKILAAGNTTLSELDLGQIVAQYNEDGSPDLAFGDSGKTEAKAKGQISLIKVQEDTKIITGGENNGELQMIRFTEEGALDGSFGNKGIVTTNISFSGIGLASSIADLALQKDGKIVVTGYGIDRFETGTSASFIVRYNEDGSIDKSFGNDGFVFLEYDESIVYLSSINIQPDNKIIVGGKEHDFVTKDNYIVARYLTDGTVDKEFGINGISRLYFQDKHGESAGLTDIAIEIDGRIVAAGYYGIYPAQVLTVARFNSDGSVDSTFATNGYFTKPDVENRSYANAVQISNKKIIVEGYSEVFNFFVMQFLPDGTIDSAFGENGEAGVNLKKGNGGATSGTVQKDGKIILIGNLNNNNSNGITAIVRFNGDPVKQYGPIAKRIRRWIRNHTLQWQPLNDNDISYYSIQQSSNGVSGFKEIGKVVSNKLYVVSKESNVYSFSLSNASAQSSQLTAQGSNYYRITAVSIRSSNITSDVIQDESVSSVTISPNPVKDVMKISGLPVNQKSTINIINRNGNVLQSAICNNTVCNLNVAQLKSGFYTVQVISSGKTQTLKFVKE